MVMCLPAMFQHQDVSSNVVVFFPTKLGIVKHLPYNQVCAEQSRRGQYLSIALIHFEDCLYILEIVMLQYFW